MLFLHSIAATTVIIVRVPATFTTSSYRMLLTRRIIPKWNTITTCYRYKFQQYHHQQQQQQRYWNKSGSDVTSKSSSSFSSTCSSTCSNNINHDNDSIHRSNSSIIEEESIRSTQVVLETKRTTDQDELISAETVPTLLKMTAFTFDTDPDIDKLSIEDLETRIAAVNGGKRINCKDRDQVSIAVFGKVQTTTKQILWNAYNNINHYPDITVQGRELAKLILHWRHRQRPTSWTTSSRRR